MKILTLLLLTTTLAFGQTTESLIPQMQEDNTSLILNAGPIQAQSSLVESTVDLKAAPFHRALQAASNESLSISPINNLTISFNQKKQAQESLKLNTLNLWEQNSFAFDYTQDKSKVSFSQNTVENYNPLVWDTTRELKTTTRKTSQIFGLQQGIGTSVFSFNKQIDRTTEPHLFDSTIVTNSFSANMPLNLGFAQPTINYVNSNTQKDSQTTAFNRGIQINMPFANNATYTGNFSKSLKGNNLTKVNEYGLSLGEKFNFQRSNTTVNNTITKHQAAFGVSVVLFDQPIEYKHSYDQNLVKTSINRQDFSYFNMPLQIGSFKTSLSFKDERTSVAGVVVAQNKTEDILLPLFGHDAKYTMASLTKQEKKGIVQDTNTTITIPLGDLTTYSYTNAVQNINGVLSARNMQESVQLPLDKIMKGLQASHLRTIKVVPGQPEIDLKQQKILIPLNFVAAGAEYQFLLQSRSVDNQPVVNTRQNSFKLPFYNNRANVSYVMTQQEDKRTNKLDVTYPIVVLGIPFQALYSHIDLPNGNTDSRFSTKIQIPISVMGKSIENQHSIAYSSLGQDNVTSTMSLPFSFGPVKLTQTRISDTTNTNIYTVETPNIPIDNVNINANLWMQNSKQKQIYNLGWNPSDRLKTAVALTMNDLKPAEHQKLTFDTCYNLSKRTSLNFRYLEQQQLDSMLDQSQSMLTLQHTNDGLSVQATLIDLNGQNVDNYSSTKVMVGENKPFQLSFYTIDYDVKKLQPLSERTYAIEAKHIQDRTGVAVKYQDDAARVDSLLSVDVYWQIDAQTKLTMAMVDNGIDPNDAKKQAIRLGQAVDLGFIAKMRNNIALNAGIRQYDENDWFNIGIAGGNTKTGTIALTYQSGDFVPVRKTNTPESTLSLQYDKKWGDYGSLFINLSQEVTESENTEARAEWQMKF